nr:MAG TPA: hypothetical protein [Caudoviricetes sp.]
MQIWNTVCNAPTSFVISDYSVEKLAFWYLIELPDVKSLNLLDKI